MHLEKVVHRDIKPDNIVIVKEQPVLIDFGLVFDPAEERITQLDSAVGNARFSPDQMMNRQEDVLPWLDVFQLSQLLIWMVSDKPTKTWSRPLDWRWVIYPQEMKDTHVLSIKAITAICSDPSTSPSDAMELNKLISNLINFDYSISHTDPSVNEIIETVKSAKAKSVLNSSSDLSLFNSTFPIFEKFYYQFESHVKELAKLGSNILPIKLEEKEKFEHWADNVKKTKKFTSHSANYPYDLRCGEVNSGNFWLTTVNIFYVPSQLEEKSGTDYLPDGFLPLAFHFGIGSNKDALQRMHPRRLFIGIDKTGKLWYSDDSGNFKSSRQETSVKEICDLLTSWIKHSGSWEIINT